MADKKNEKLSKDNNSSNIELNLNDTLQKDIVVRLRRIEGQVKGVEKMVSNEVCCRDILVQVAAVRSAMNKVGGLMLENYAKNCLLTSGEEVTEEKLQGLISTFLMFLK